MNKRCIKIITLSQQLHCCIGSTVHRRYVVSTAKNGLGEQMGSECTPRGLHRIASIIGAEQPVNSVFIARQWTGEYYTSTLATAYPKRDWILTRIITLDGLEEGFNRGGSVDSLSRFIYIHGTPDSTRLGVVGSRGCIRMRNADIIELVNWVEVGMLVDIC